ncbi:metal ABC transporter solute-binding protein, Zn/Mn family [candidate division KSB1 bacterium]
MKKLLIGVLTAVALLMVPDRAEGLGVAVSVLPQAYFVERIGGPAVEVTVMIPPGANPAIFEPTVAGLSRLARAEVYIKVGHSHFPFEAAWLPRLLSVNPDLRVIDSSAGLSLDPEDPHIWLSPKRARAQAMNIYSGLAETDPGNSAEYERNLNILLADIDKLDREIADLLAPARGRRFMVYHPAWGYLAEDYGLGQLVIEAEGHEPGPSRLSDLISEARRSGVKVILIQPQFSRRSAEVVARETGCRLIEADPLAGDWAVNLKSVARRLATALSN